MDIMISFYRTWHQLLFLLLVAVQIITCYECHPPKQLLFSAKWRQNATKVGRCIGQAGPAPQYNALVKSRYRVHMLPCKSYGKSRDWFAGPTPDLVLGRNGVGQQSAMLTSTWRERYEGKVLCNGIPGIYTASNKATMIRLLRSWYEQHNCSLNEGGLVPQQWLLMDGKDCDDFRNNVVQKAYKYKGQRWVVKPPHSSQGTGVKFYGDLNWFKSCGNVLVQKYVKPFLVEDRKFDMRHYMLIAGTDPITLYWHPGYARRSLYVYNETANFGEKNSGVHLTNVFVQKKLPHYAGSKVIWSMDQLGDYLADGGFMTKASFMFRLRTFFMKVVQHLYQSSSHIIKRVSGGFHMVGVDVMMDEKLDLYLIEVNHYPAINANSDWQRLFHRQMLPSLFEVALAVNLGDVDIDRLRFGERFGQESSYGNWELVWHEYWKTSWVDAINGPVPCSCEGKGPARPELGGGPMGNQKVNCVEPSQLEKAPSPCKKYKTEPI